jgi:hypothetical protein
VDAVRNSPHRRATRPSCSSSNGRDVARGGSARSAPAHHALARVPGGRRQEVRG